MRADSKARVGKSVGSGWRLDAILGEGGAACVYAASQGGLRAAVKVLHAEMAANDEVRTRFVREAKVANAIQHAGVVKILEDGISDDDAPFLVMELLEGETLEDRWYRKGERLPPKEVLWAADQILDVLGAAHKLGLVHRDVKPENVFLTFDRKVKLLDFGIAGLREMVADATRIGTVMGTPAFMPPEQARGDWMHVGVQTDLWAVGATMFTLLSGRLVHDEAHLFDQLRAATSKPAVSLAKVAPEIPAPIVGLVDHALAFNAKNRWPNARAMQYAVRAAYAEWRRGASGVVEDDGMEISEPPLLFEKPDAPPMSLARPPRK